MFCYSQCNMTENRNKRYYQKETELSFVDDEAVYLEHPRESTETWLELIRCLSKGLMQNKYLGTSGLHLYKNADHSIFYTRK